MFEFSITKDEALGVGKDLERALKRAAEDFGATLLEVRDEEDMTVYVYDKNVPQRLITEMLTRELLAKQSSMTPRDRPRSPVRVRPHRRQR